MMAKSTGLTPGEKKLLLGCSLFTALLLGIIAWHAGLEINPVITVPAPVMPRPNALDYYLQAGELVDAVKVTDGRATFGSEALEKFIWPEAPAAGDTHGNTLMTEPPPTWRDVEMFGNRLAPAFALLHRGLTHDCHDIPIRSQKQEELEQNIARYNKCIALARALAIAGRLKMRQGDWPGALACDLDALQLGEEMQHGEGLMSGDIGSDCQICGRRDVWTIVRHLPGPQARAATRRLATIMARTPSYADRLREDKKFFLTQINEPLSQAAVAPYSFGQAMGNANYADFLRSYMYGKRDLLRQWTRIMDKGIAGAGQPYSATNNRPGITWDNSCGAAGLWVEFVSNRYRCDFTANETQNSLLSTACALQAYHTEHGRYPDQLSALTPAYLPAIPVDPFGVNKPLCYKRTGANYLLYSIGPDGVDDGGKASSDGRPGASNTARITSYSKGDIVAGVNVR